MDGPETFDQLLKNDFLSKNKFYIDINNENLVISNGKHEYKIGTINFDTYNVEELKEEYNNETNEVLQTIIDKLETPVGGKRKSKKGKRSRKARKSRRKSNRRRGRR